MKIVKAIAPHCVRCSAGAAILFSIVLLIAGCASAATPSTSKPSAPTGATNLSGGTFIRAMTSEPGSLDPQGAPNSGLSLVMPYIFDTLVVYDNDNKLMPLLAENWPKRFDLRFNASKILGSSRRFTTA